MAKITVVGVVVADNGVMLFVKDAQPLVLAQDSFQTKAVLEAVMPDLMKGPGAAVEIDLDDYTLEKHVSRLTNGAVQIAKNDNGEQKISVFGVELKNGHLLMPHLERLAAGEGAKGFKKFIANYKKIKHSATAQELLHWMNVGDLPIADDGCIIGYKILRRDRRNNERFVDPHSGTVSQGLGSMVTMPYSKVLDNRRVLCGTGLHIAARDYVQFFSGDVLTLVKIRPQDVVSVSESENTKMRVCSYHIVGVLNDEDYSRVKHRTPFPIDSNGARLLADAVTGNHVAVLEVVKIGEGNNPTNKKIETKKTKNKKNANNKPKSKKGITQLSGGMVEKTTPRAVNKMMDAMSGATDVTGALTKAAKKEGEKKPLAYKGAPPKSSKKRSSKAPVEKKQPVKTTKKATTSSKGTIFEHGDKTYVAEDIIKLVDDIGQTNAAQNLGCARSTLQNILKKAKAALEK